MNSLIDFAPANLPISICSRLQAVIWYRHRRTISIDLFIQHQLNFNFRECIYFFLHLIPERERLQIFIWPRTLASLSPCQSPSFPSPRSTSIVQELECRSAPPTFLLNIKTPIPTHLYSVHIYDTPCCQLTLDLVEEFLRCLTSSLIPTFATAPFSWSISTNIDVPPSRTDSTQCQTHPHPINPKHIITQIYQTPANANKRMRLRNNLFVTENAFFLSYYTNLNPAGNHFDINFPFLDLLQSPGELPIDSDHVSPWCYPVASLGVEEIRESKNTRSISTTGSSPSS